MDEVTTISAEKTKVPFKKKFKITKKKVLRSLLGGFAAPIILILCAGFNLFFTNAEELGFSFGDFAPLWIVLTLVVGFAAFLSLLFTKKVAHRFLFSLYSFVAVAGYAQYMYTILTFKGLPADHGDIALASTATKIINLTIWLVIGIAFIWFGVSFKKPKIARRVMTYLLILAMIMQVFATVPNAITYISENSKKESDTESSFLSLENILEVSENNNILVFVLDRFDAVYYEDMRESYPEYMGKLDGFTYYSDNISTYPRTYPAVTSMITGINNQFVGQDAYFGNAYKDSPFLNDLHDNDYKINLYITDHYAYNDASVFGDLVDNTVDASGHTISDPIALQTRMLKLSSYFWSPEAFKATDVSAKSFDNLINYNTEIEKYQMTTASDAQIYQDLCSEGLSTHSGEGTFSFIHLRGSHLPAYINENCEVFTDQGAFEHEDAVNQTAGVFKLITEYLDQLKAQGLYEDATIIITGDHGKLVDDISDYKKPIRTALLVKQSGEANIPLRESKAQVSQENLHASIIKSAGIKTTRDYGRAYWEISPDETVTRTHYFQTWTKIADKNVTYKITGPAADINNWEIVDRKDIGELYK